MAEPAAEQSKEFGARVMMAFFFLCALSFTLSDAVRAFSEPVGNDPSHPAIKQSAFLPPLCCWGGVLSLAFTQRGKAPDDRFIRVTQRICWAYVCTLCLLHIAIAFHLGHGWSHAAAWEHTRQVGGYGDGIYVNYAFALVLLADAIWLCVAFDSYFARPRWLHWTVHIFLAFVVFNAAVVFGSWKMRRWFAVWCILLPALVVWVGRIQRRIKADEEARAKGALSANPESGDTSPVDKN